MYCMSQKNYTIKLNVELAAKCLYICISYMISLKTSNDELCVCSVEYRSYLNHPNLYSTHI